MKPSGIETRLRALEIKVDALEQKFEKVGSNDWLDDVVGSFAGSKAHEIAMKLGRRYRKSSRPKARNRRNAGARH